MSLFNLKRKDVTPDTDKREKRAFVRYFEILIANFMKVVLVNLIYFACLLPLLCGLTTFVCGFLGLSAAAVESFFFVHLFVWLTSVVTSFSWVIALLLFVASLIAYGPLTAGLTFCMRNIATGRHIWISDLFSRAKSNLKQGIALGLIDVLVVLSFVFYISSDLSVLQGGGLIFYRVLKILAIAISVIYVVIRFYSYTIAVTFELPIKDIFKNCGIFIVLGFFKNILALLVCFLIIFGFISTPKIDIILIGSLMFALMRYSVIFCTYSVIDEYMIKPNEREEITE